MSLTSGVPGTFEPWCTLFCSRSEAEPSFSAPMMMRLNLVAWMQLSSRERTQQSHKLGPAILWEEGFSVLFWVLLLLDHPAVSSFSCTPRCLFLGKTHHITFFPKSLEGLPSCALSRRDRKTIASASGWASAP